MKRKKHSKKQNCIMVIIALIVFAFGGYFIFQQFNRERVVNIAEFKPECQQITVDVNLPTIQQENVVQANYDGNNTNSVVIEDELKTLSNYYLIPVSSTNINQESKIMKTVKLERVANSGIYSLPEGNSFAGLKIVTLNGNTVPKDRYKLVIGANDEIDIFDSKLGNKNEIVSIVLE